MAYRDLHYSLGKFKSDVRSRIARKNPLRNADTLPLAMWIFEERLAVKAMRLSAEHRPKTVQAFDEWIVEHPELEDLGSGLVQLLYKEAEIETDVLQKHQQAAQVIRTIYERDLAEVADIRDKRAAVKSRLEHYDLHHQAGRKEEDDRVKTKLEAQLSDLTSREQKQQRDMGDYTRLALREAFYMKLNATHAYGHKASMLARTGSKLILQEQKEIDSAQQLLMDCMLAVDGWEPEERPTVLDMLFHLDGQEDVDAALLTDFEVSSGAAAAALNGGMQVVGDDDDDEMLRNEKWIQAELLSPPEYKEKDNSRNQ